MNNSITDLIFGFLIGAITLIICLGIFSTCSRQEKEPFIPTAITTEFEGNTYIIFYDKHGEIINVVPDPDNYLNEFD